MKIMMMSLIIVLTIEVFEIKKTKFKKNSQPRSHPKDHHFQNQLNLWSILVFSLKLILFHQTL